MNPRLRLSKSGAAAQLFPRLRRSRESRAEGGGEQARDGREQLRGEHLRPPEVHGPSSGQKQFGRCIQVDSAQRRRDVFPDDQADAVPGPEVVPVPAEPGGPGARLGQGSGEAGPARRRLPSVWSTSLLSFSMCPFELCLNQRPLLLGCICALLSRF